MENPAYEIYIAESLEIEALKIGKPLTWFRFAKKHAKSGGYRFLAHKEAQMEVLERIARSLSTRMRSLTTGQIMDILAERVNAV
jgi:hypothetical protein